MKVNVEILKNKETLFEFLVEAFDFEITNVQKKIAEAIMAKLKQLNQ